MAIAFVQTVGTAVDAAASATLQLTISGLATPTTVGNHLILIALHRAQALTAISDNKSQTWQINDVTVTSAQPFGSISSLKITSSQTNGDTITITQAASATGMAFAVLEFSGLDPTTWLDVTAKSTGTGTAVDSTATATTSQADELLVGFSTESGTTTYTPEVLSPVWTQLAQLTPGSVARKLDSVYRIVSSTGTYSNKATLGTSRTWAAGIATYKAAAAAGNQTATPGVASLTLTTFAPTVTASDLKTATPGVASLVLTTFAPSVNIGVNVVPGVVALTLTTFAPTVTATANQVVTPGVVALVLSPKVPTVTATDFKTATPGVATLVLSTFAPTVTVATGSVVATPGTATLVLTAYPPTIQRTGLPVRAIRRTWPASAYTDIFGTLDHVEYFDT